MRPRAVPGRDRQALWRPDRWIFWAFAGLLVFGTVSFGSTFLPEIMETPVGVTVGVIANVILALILIRIIDGLEVFQKEPRMLLAAALGWGGLVATAFAIRANHHIGALTTKVGGTGAPDWIAAASGPISEETLKALGVVAILMIGREHVQRPMDGLIYGMMVGVGFEVVENVVYGVNSALSDPNDDLQGALATTATRLVAGVGLHAVATGVSGLGLGYAFTRTDRSMARRVAVALALFAGAWGVHFLWNSPLLSGAGAVGPILKMAIVVVFFFLVYRYASRIEWGWFARTVAGEPPEVIAPEEVEALRTRRLRRRARKAARKQGGRRAGRLAAQLQREQLTLAVALEDARDPTRQAGVDRAREAIRAIRARLADAGVARPTAGTAAPG